MRRATAADEPEVLILEIAERREVFVEIRDAATGGRMARWPYRVVVSPATNRRRREVYPIDLHARLPRVSVPLLAGDAVALDLQTVFADIYEKGAYARRIDYGAPPDPPLTAEQEAWARDALSRVARGGA